MKVGETGSSSGNAGREREGKCRVGGVFASVLETVRLSLGGEMRLSKSVDRVVVVARIRVIILVEVWKGVADVLQVNLGRDATKVERMDSHRAYEPWQSDLLEPIVNESTDRFCESDTVGPCSQRFPLNVD